MQRSTNSLLNTGFTSSTILSRKDIPPKYLVYRFLNVVNEKFVSYMFFFIISLYSLFDLIIIAKDKNSIITIKLLAIKFFKYLVILFSLF